MAYSGLKPELQESRPTTVGAGLEADRGEWTGDPISGELATATRTNDLVARKIADLRHYDVLGIERVVAICCWGRSGSYFLASLLDGHDDVLTMPFSLGELIYLFWERHKHLPLRDKLLAYPDFVADMQHDATFFGGEFRIGEADYRASVT